MAFRCVLSGVNCQASSATPPQQGAGGGPAGAVAVTAAAAACNKRQGLSPRLEEAADVPGRLRLPLSGSIVAVNNKLQKKPATNSQRRLSVGGLAAGHLLVRQHHRPLHQHPIGQVQQQPQQQQQQQLQQQQQQQQRLHHRHIAATAGGGGETVVQLFPSSSPAAAIAPVAVVRYGRVGFAATAPPNVKGGDVFASSGGVNRGPGVVNFVSAAGGRSGVVISTQRSAESEHAVNDSMGSVNKSVSLRLPPGAGTKRIVNTSTSSPAATATAATVAVAATTNNNISGRFTADHHDYHLQQPEHPQHHHHLNGRGGDNGVNGGASGGNGGIGFGGGGLKPLTNGRGTFTLVKRGGVISNGGKMVTTSTNGGPNNNNNINNSSSSSASNENNHVREIYPSPTLFNGAGGTATVTAIVPTTTRITSHSTATTSALSSFTNNNRLMNNNNNTINNKNNTSSTNNSNSNPNTNTNNQINQISTGSASKANSATSGVMLPPNKKLTASKTTIIIGKVNAQQSQEINGNHNYSVRDISRASTTASSSTVAAATTAGVASSVSTTFSMTATSTPAAAAIAATTLQPIAIAAAATTTATTTIPVAVTKVSSPAAKSVSATVARNTMSTTEDEEDDDDNGIVADTIQSRLRLTTNHCLIQGNITESGPARVTISRPATTATGGATVTTTTTTATATATTTTALPTTTITTSSITASSTTTTPSSTSATAAAAGTTTITTTTTPTTIATTAGGAAASTASSAAETSRVGNDSKDESEIAKRKDELPSSSNFVGRFSADPSHIFAVDCEAQLRRMHELNRKNDAVTQRIHRIQTKSTVEVAYSELKQVIAQGQEVFKMPCLMSKSGQIAAQLANKEKSGNPLQRKLSESDSAKLVRGCGIHSTLIANSEKLCDSSATESSSEEEDLPERVEIFNGRKILTPFQYASSYSSCTPQHPAWRWASERASLGARWTWLQAQVSELEYRIRQQHELCRQLRLRKEPCLQQPEAANHVEEHSRCARTTPLNKSFTKRRLVVAHTISAEAAESVPLDALSLSCECGTMYPHVELCVRCSLLHAQSARERFDISEERQQEEFQLTRQLMAIPLWDSQSEISRMAVYDETYHPVLSGRHDISLSLHYENLLRMGYSLLVHKNAVAESSSETLGAAGKKKKEHQLGTPQQQVLQLLQQQQQQHQQQQQQQQQQRSAAVTPEPSEADDDAPPTKRKRHSSHAANRPSRSEKRGNTGGALRPPDGVSKKRRADRRFTTTSGRRSMSVDSQEQADDELFADIGDRSHQNRARRTSHVNQQEYSYDIDNIVIPYGMMSSTRLVERLKYKEILTPKWRILHIDPVDVASKDNEQSAQVEGSATVTEKVTSAQSETSSFAMDDEDTVLAVKDNETEEDMSDAAFEARHGRQETLERERFSVYLQPKLVSNIGSPSASSRSRLRTESTDVQKSKDFSTQATPAAAAVAAPAAAAAQTPARAKEILDESSLLGSDIGGKSESTAKLHASKAKRQHRSLSQDWTMLQSSSAPTPYPPRSFPLSGDEFEKILQENSDSDEVEKGCETVSVDENSTQKQKEKPRKSTSKDVTSSSSTTAATTITVSQVSSTEQKADDSFISKTLHDKSELQLPVLQPPPPQQQQEQQQQQQLRQRPIQQEQQKQQQQQQQQNKQNQASELREKSLLQPDVEDRAGHLNSRVSNEPLDVEENSEDKLASSKSPDHNEDFDMADDNSNSHTSHRHDHWLNAGCDKVNEADILDEIANPEWSADETEPED